MPSVPHTQCPLTLIESGASGRAADKADFVLAFIACFPILFKSAPSSALSGEPADYRTAGFGPTFAMSQVLSFAQQQPAAALSSRACTTSGRRLLSAAAPAPARGVRRGMGLAVRAHQVELEMAGATHVLEVPDDMSILEVALDKGLDVPHDCKMGVCMNCSAKLVSLAPTRRPGSGPAASFVVTAGRGPRSTSASEQ